MNQKFQKDVARYGLVSGFVPILILIFLVAIVGAGYFAYKNGNLNSYKSPSTSSSPSTMATADSTENWKTYADSLIGVSFQYPSQTSAGETKLIRSDDNLSVSLGIDRRDIFLFVLKKYPNDKINDWISEEKKSNSIYQNAEFQDTIFQGYNAKTASRIENGPFVTKQIIIQKGSVVYLLSINIFELAKESDQILSTFKFINK